MENKKDRRIIRTRTMLSNALIALMQEKDYAQISIKDIANRANIGRSTFYEHFENKDQLLFSGHEDLKDVLESCRRFDKLDNTKLLLEALFAHISKYKSISNVVLSNTSGVIMLERLRQIMEDYYKRKAQKEIIDKDLINLFSFSFSHSFVGFIKYWLLNDNGTIRPDYAIQKMEEILNSFLLIAKKNGV